LRILGSILEWSVKRRILAVAIIAAYEPACDDAPQSHVYVAAQYSPAGACFGPSVSLAQVDTPTGDLDCAPTCLVLTAPGGSTDIYVSTMCGPYPATYDVTQTDPGCPAALGAWPAEESALLDGTNSCASSPSSADDGGGDAAKD
jgi:hypothetical protein